MQVTYTTTIEDYVAYSRHFARNSPAVRINFVIGWLVFPGLAAIAALILVFIEDLWPIAIIVAVAGAASLFIYPTIHWAWYDAVVRTHAKNHCTRGVIGEITLILTDESLVEITETTRSEAKWKDMHGVASAGDDYTFIFVTGLSAAIVPREGFDSDKEYEAVRDFANERVRKFAAHD